jgi:hypothetical protein
MQQWVCIHNEQTLNSIKYATSYIAFGHYACELGIHLSMLVLYCGEPVKLNPHFHQYSVGRTIRGHIRTNKGSIKALIYIYEYIYILYRRETLPVTVSQGQVGVWK